MWLSFVGAVLASLAVVYVPGYFVSRAFSFGRIVSAALAPLFSSLVLTALGVVLAQLDVECPGLALFALALAVCMAVWGIVVLIRRTRYKGAAERASAEQAPAEQVSAERASAAQARVDLLNLGENSQVLKTAGLYVGVALLVAIVVFLLAIGDPNAFSRHDDSTLHLAAIRGFMETGAYSTLNVGAYLDQGVAGSYYPASWYIPVAIVASLFGGEVIMANNACTFAFLVFVFPLALCLLFCKLFPNNGVARNAGALFALAFAGFPWGFLVFGQLLPNMMAFMFVPPVLVLIMEATESLSKGSRIMLSCAALLGLLSIALAQPNGAFTCGIWAVLFGVSRFFHEPDSTTAQFTRKRALGAIALFAGACVVWALAYNAPFLQSVVQYTREALLRPYEAFGAGLLFMFTYREGIQPFLTVVVLMGVVYTLRNRRFLWLSVAYIAAFAFYIIDMSTEGVLKHVLTGFWYTDYWRTGAMTALFAMPVAALGFSWLFELLKGAFARLAHKDAEGEWAGGSEAVVQLPPEIAVKSNGAADSVIAARQDSSHMVRVDELNLMPPCAPAETPPGLSSGTSEPPRSVASTSNNQARRGAIAPVWATIASAATLVVIMAAIQFVPFGTQYSKEIEIKAGLPKVQSVLADYYSWDRWLTKEEFEFAQRALGEVPEGALIANVPNDGSCWLYGSQGSNIFFRRLSTTGMEDSKSSKLLRTKLCDVATNEKVRSLVDELNVRYVLALDASSSSDPTVYDLRYKPDDWQGIESITESTPGFTLLASEGDMRFYQIDEV